VYHFVINILRYSLKRIALVSMQEKQVQASMGKWNKKRKKFRIVMIFVKK